MKLSSKRIKSFSILFIISILLISSINAQDISSISSNKFGKGIQVTAQDSSWSMKFGARFQTLYEGNLDRNTDNYDDKLLVKRARLKFDGFAFTPNLTYNIQLGLTNRDIRAGQIDQSGNTAAIIYDAVLKWKFSKNWELWFGQAKLPGNRERVISSQKLQFVDRSLVNSRFNIDRATGIQLRHKNKIGNLVVKEMFSISMGEGRNITANNVGGYDYTGRIEILPMGEFIGKGDYFGSDLKREPSPKLAIGLTYDFIYGAGKQRGQLGDYLDILGIQITNDLKTFFADAIFKYNGWSIMSEYANKSAGNDIATIKYGTGEGFVMQAGYLLNSNFEIAGRYTKIDPDNLNFSSLDEETEYTLGLSKYIVEHNLKVQSDFSTTKKGAGKNSFRFRFQVELAF